MIFILLILYIFLIQWITNSSSFGGGGKGCRTAPRRDLTLSGKCPFNLVCKHAVWFSGKVFMYSSATILFCYGCALKLCSTVVPCKQRLQQNVLPNVRGQVPILRQKERLDLQQLWLLIQLEQSEQSANLWLGIVRCTRKTW